MWENHPTMTQANTSWRTEVITFPRRMKTGAREWERVLQWDPWGAAYLYYLREWKFQRGHVYVQSNTGPNADTSYCFRSLVPGTTLEAFLYACHVAMLHRIKDHHSALSISRQRHHAIHEAARWTPDRISGLFLLRALK